MCEAVRVEHDRDFSEGDALIYPAERSSLRDPFVDQLSALPKHVDIGYKIDSDSMDQLGTIFCLSSLVQRD